MEIQSLDDWNKETEALLLRQREVIDLLSQSEMSVISILRKSVTIVVVNATE